MSATITDLLYVERNVGGTFKSTKKQYIWEFSLNGERHKIEMFDSKLSGKKKVIKDGIIECDTVCEESFFKNFSINGHNCTIIQCGDKNELRIDNQTFEHMYNLERNKQFFSNNPEPTSSFYQAKSTPVDMNPSINQMNFYNNDNEKNKKPALFNFNIKPAGEGGNKGLKAFKFGKNAGIGTGVGVSREQNINNTSNQRVSPISNSNQQMEGNQKEESNLLDLIGLNNDNSNNNNNNNNSSNVQMVNQNKNTMNDLMDIFGSSSNNSNTNSNMNMQMNNMQNNGSVNLMNLGIDLTNNNNNNQMQMNNFNQINQQTNFMNPLGNNQVQQQSSNNPFDALLLQGDTQSIPQVQSNVNPQLNNPNNPFNNDFNSLFG